MILLRTGVWLASQVGIHTIFIREKIHGTTTHSLRIYLKKNNNNINKSHPLVKARQASQLFKPACGGFVATFLQETKCLERRHCYTFIMYSGLQGIRQQIGGARQGSGAVNAPPCCPVCAALYEPKLSVTEDICAHSGRECYLLLLGYNCCWELGNVFRSYIQVKLPHCKNTPVQVKFLQSNFT